MNSVKFLGLGWEGFTCQISRIREAIKSLGHELTEDNPDLIYCNDPSVYQRAIELKKKFPKTILFFNFLDVPWHFPEIEKTMVMVNQLLIHADIVSVISHKVKNDLAKFYNGDIEVIYNPSKDVSFDEKIKKDNIFLYVGRANDQIKRIKLIKDTFINNKENINKIKICGSENPGFGEYLGVVSDKELNKLYNSSKFVLLPSKAEGIGLPMIEGMICGSIPISCSDNLTAKEFSPPDFICDPNPDSLIKKIEYLNKNYDKKRKLALEFGKKYKIQFNKKNIAKNIIHIFNSR